jgi:uncharacterized membrane protein YdbT with pleckstrin-like domain
LVKISLQLTDGETVRYESRISWQSQWLLIILGLLTLWTIIGAIFFWGIAALNVYSSKYQLTNKRVYIRYGMVGRRIFELKNEWITSYTIHQGFFGRILNFGNVIFATPGYLTGTSAMVGLSNPIGVKSMVDVNVSQLRNANEINDKIRRLEEEHDYGRIEDIKYNRP